VIYYRAIASSNALAYLAWDKFALCICEEGRLLSNK
jgi:hypothetical protein